MTGSTFLDYALLELSIEAISEDSEQAVSLLDEQQPGPGPTASPHQTPSIGTDVNRLKERFYKIMGHWKVSLLRFRFRDRISMYPTKSSRYYLALSIVHIGVDASRYVVERIL